MRHSNEQSLKEVIDELLDTYKLRSKLNEVRLQHAWESLMGNAIAKRTEKIYLRNKTLFIKVTSAPLKTELLFEVDKIKKILNEELGGEFIEEVKIT